MIQEDLYFQVWRAIEKMFSNSYLLKCTYGNG